VLVYSSFLGTRDTSYRFPAYTKADNSFRIATSLYGILIFACNSYTNLIPFLTLRHFSLS
jgi:hypothetical protein